MTIVLGPPQRLPCPRMVGTISKPHPPRSRKAFWQQQKHDDPDILGLTRQCVEHPFDTVVVRAHDRIVQSAGFGQHTGEILPLSGSSTSKG